MIVFYNKFNQFSTHLFLIKFGEIDISPTIVILISTLTVITFLAVAISSFKLVQSAIDDD